MTAPQPPSSPQPAGRGLLPLLALLVFGVPAVLVVWQPWKATPPPDGQPEKPPRAAPPDPRVTFDTPYRNVRPEVKYVGDSACAGCHEGHAKTYREHPMGRSLAPVAAATPIERFDTPARNPFTAGGFTYRVDRQGGTVRHVETVESGGKVVAETAAEVKYAVGSGHNGRAYLIDHDGFLFASPITWYPQKQQWDLSPGYEKQNPHFGRPITADCLFCHANFADHVSGTPNRYREPVFHGLSIGCERCHGPGELHVRRHGSGEKYAGPDDTIVNPAKLEHSLREAVCQQCHLQGQARVWRRGREAFDYRPGLPFQAVMTEFVKTAKDAAGAKFVGSVEQMYSSTCFRKGTGPGKMGCVSCHDPHALPAPEKKVAFYRDRCLNCHKDRGCSLPPAARQEKQDDCAACHMPPTGSNVNHTTISDHRILRRPDPPAQRPEERPLAPGEDPLVHFHAPLLPGPDPEVDRDRGIALIRLADRQPPGEVTRGLAARALPLLEAAVARDDEDLPAREARANALWFLGRLDEAREAYEQTLERAPDRETSLFLAANLALRQQRTGAAQDYAERAVRANPWRWECHRALAQARAQARDWPAAERACRAVLKLHAAEPGTRHLLVVCRLAQGDRAGAQKEFDTLLALSPPDADKLRQWFAQQVR